MRNWLRRLGLVSRRQPAPARRPLYHRPRLELLEGRVLLSADFVQTNLVSNIVGLAQNHDGLLRNPWGLTYGPGGPFWVSDNANGWSTLYTGTGSVVPFNITVPGQPTGTVFNTAGSGFNVTQNGVTGPAGFIFDSLDGTISAWSHVFPNNSAVVAMTEPGASFTGLTMDTDSIGRNLLYAADLATGKIDVFNSSFSSTTVPGGFVDPHIPANFHPFNVQNLGGLLYVTYAKFDPSTGQDMPGPGHGFVDVFNSDGVLQTGNHALVSHGALSSPWGLAIAPSNFGAFSNDLLVGNNGDGTIHAYNPRTGAFVGELMLGPNHPFQEDNLWALKFGNGGAAGPTDNLFFTAGIGATQTDGLFGSLQAVAPLAKHSPIVPNLPTTAEQTFNTVPPNGDLNPYGVAFVPKGIKSGGMLQAGDILVSNFNNSSNLQGTGGTIMLFGPHGEHSVFFQGQNLGLTTALGVLKSGFVIVGNVPTTDGTSATIGQTSLMFLDSNGNLVANLTDNTLLNGPWDLTINDMGNTAQVFVANVLSGSITRIDLKIPHNGTPIVESMTEIASGYSHRPDSAAFEVGPTGLAYDPVHDVLYVASTADNAIFAIHRARTRTTDAGIGKLIYQDNAHLRGPLGLVLAPNGDLITTNGDAINGDPNQPSELVEFTKSGHFVAQMPVNPTGQGGAFGIALSTDGSQIRFAAVDDIANTLDVWTFDKGKGF
ncbi:MAG TPA: TIGR03118 family protein [Gemmataceae bacterium]|nr:TIGR03118 family protein [Gemmataceae bacterium]